VRCDARAYQRAGAVGLSVLLALAPGAACADDAAGARAGQATVVPAGQATVVPAGQAIVAPAGQAIVAPAGQAIVAMATNFARAGTKLVASFTADAPHRITVTFGSTGKLYAQIRAGAPFDVFLAADQLRPRKLSEAGLAVAGSQFTYAIGQLSLWTSRHFIKAPSFAAALGSANLTLAIANPDLAPYGVAARQALKKAKLWAPLQPRIVMGENIGQTFALVATGNATFGFVARSQLSGKAGKSSGGAAQGREWPVPSHFHDPIRQDAVLLTRASGNTAAKAFLAYLKTTNARAIMRQLGYKAVNE